MRSSLFLFQINTARTAKAMEKFTTRVTCEAPSMANAIKAIQAKAIVRAFPSESPMNLTMAEYTIEHAKFMNVLKTKIMKMWSILIKYWEWCPVHRVRIPSLLKFITRLNKLLRYQEKTFVPAMTKACSSTLWYERGARLTRIHNITRRWAEGLMKPLVESPTSSSCFV